MGLFNKAKANTVHKTDQDNADELLANALVAAKGAYGDLTFAIDLNDDIISSTVLASTAEAGVRDSIIDAARANYERAIEANGVKIANAQASRAQAKAAADALSAVVGTIG